MIIHHWRILESIECYTRTRSIGFLLFMVQGNTQESLAVSSIQVLMSLCNKRVSLHIKLVNNKQAANKHASLCAIMFLTKYSTTDQETAGKAPWNKGGPRGPPPQRTGLEGDHEAEDQYNRHKNKRTLTQGTKDPELSRQWLRRLLPRDWNSLWISEVNTRFK